MGVNGKLMSQDVETILFKILNGSSSLKSMISGMIYKEGYRPTNSDKEDISVSTLALSMDQPQVAVCNINAHVPDVAIRTAYVPDSVKLRALADKIKEVIDTALLDPLYKDLSFRIDYQKTFKNQDSEMHQHFQNLRLELIIPNS